MHFLASLQDMQSKNDKIPTYILINRHPLTFPTRKHVEIYLKEFHLLFDYLSTVFGVQKLSILAFEEGALLTFRALSEGPTEIFKTLQKVVLINLYNPKIRIEDD